MEGGEKMSDISRQFGTGKFYRNMICRRRGGVVYQLFPRSLHNGYKWYIQIISNRFTKIGTQSIDIFKEEALLRLNKNLESW